MNITRTAIGYRAGRSEVATGDLSPREAQFLALAAEGASRADACATMGIKHTSGHHLAQRVYYKLQARQMFQALAEARRRGYLTHYALALLILGTSAFSACQHPARNPRPPVVRVQRSRREEFAA